MVTARLGSVTAGLTVEPGDPRDAEVAALLTALTAELALGEYAPGRPPATRSSSSRRRACTSSGHGWTAGSSTGDRQTAAIAFYRRHGFVEVPRSGPSVDSATSVCMQVTLNGGGACPSGPQSAACPPRPGDH